MIGQQSGQLGASTAVQSATPMQQSMDTLDKVIAQAEQSVQFLAERLRPVRNEKPMPAGNQKDAPKPMKSSIVNGLESFASRIEGIRLYVDLINSELEV